MQVINCHQKWQSLIQELTNLVITVPDNLPNSAIDTNLILKKQVHALPLLEMDVSICHMSGLYTLG